MNSQGDPKQPLPEWALDAGLERYIPETGWGYSVVARTWYPYPNKSAVKYEVCPFYNGEIPREMDVLLCCTVADVAHAIDLIMDGKAPRYFGLDPLYDYGGEEE
mgnify:CR=1 FL=1